MDVLLAGGIQVFTGQSGTVYFEGGAQFDFLSRLEDSVENSVETQKEPIWK